MRENVSSSLSSRAKLVSIYHDSMISLILRMLCSSSTVSMLCLQLLFYDNCRAFFSAQRRSMHFLHLSRSSSRLISVTFSSSASEWACVFRFIDWMTTRMRQKRRVIDLFSKSLECFVLLFLSAFSWRVLSRSESRSRRKFIESSMILDDSTAHVVYELWCVRSFFFLIEIRALLFSKA